MKEETCGGGPLVFDDGYHKFSIAKYLMGDVEKVFAWIDKTDVIPGVFYEDAPAMITWKYKDSKRYGFMDVTFSKDLYINTDYYVCDERVEDNRYQRCPLGDKIVLRKCFKYQP
ncbi:MAG: hypothetical protein ACOX7R_01185 [Acetivibrionales bacterium]